MPAPRSLVSIRTLSRYRENDSLPVFVRASGERPRGRAYSGRGVGQRLEAASRLWVVRDWVEARCSSSRDSGSRGRRVPTGRVRHHHGPRYSVARRCCGALCVVHVTVRWPLGPCPGGGDTDNVGGAARRRAAPLHGCASRRGGHRRGTPSPPQGRVIAGVGTRWGDQVVAAGRSGEADFRGGRGVVGGAAVGVSGRRRGWHCVVSHPARRPQWVLHTGKAVSVVPKVPVGRKWGLGVPKLGHIAPRERRHHGGPHRGGVSPCVGGRPVCPSRRAQNPTAQGGTAAGARRGHGVHLDGRWPRIAAPASTGALNEASDPRRVGPGLETAGNREGRVLAGAGAAGAGQRRDLVMACPVVEVKRR